MFQTGYLVSSGKNYNTVLYCTVDQKEIGMIVWFGVRLGFGRIVFPARAGCIWKLRFEVQDEFRCKLNIFLSSNDFYNYIFFINAALLKGFVGKQVSGKRGMCMYFFLH